MTVECQASVEYTFQDVRLLPSSNIHGDSWVRVIMNHVPRSLLPEPISKRRKNPGVETTSVGEHQLAEFTKVLSKKPAREEPPKVATIDRSTPQMV